MPTNLKNRTIFCKDNLEVLKGINSNCIDLIYLDPPFNKKKEFKAPIGTTAEGASFKDTFEEKEVKDEWVEEIKEDYEGLHNFLEGIKRLSNITESKNNKHYLYNYCYLCYMAIRLIEMRRILKDTGSIYLHCDSTMSHYLKILMDIIFGEKNFRNEIIWNYGKWSNVTKNFQKNKDCILFYSKTTNYNFNGLYVEKRKNTPYHTNIVNGKGQFLVYDQKQTPEHKIKEYKDKGYKIVFVKRENVLENDTWTYLKDKNLNILNSQSKERTGYPTQKPLALLERIIKASSNKGDLVLDPFCGCATTCVASDNLERQWVGIDISIEAYRLVQERLKKEVQKIEEQGNLEVDTEIKDDYEKEITLKTDAPKRTDNLQDAGIIEKYIYIISHPQYKALYKVGIAKDYKSRLNSYQTGDPLRQYKLEYIYLTEHFRAIEPYIHQTFDNLLEWVKSSKEEIVTAIIKKDCQLKRITEKETNLLIEKELKKNNKF